MQHATLCYLLKDDQVLLGMKKRGFGEGKWNGYGGKPEPGESIEEAAIRELEEEAGILIQLQHLEKMAEIDFSFADVSKEKNWDQVVYVFFVRNWEGEPKETEEMKPQWFRINEVPINNMWIDDPHWLPLAFEGKKIKANFVFGNKGAEVLEKNVSIVTDL
tara:strand:+ start:6208 stop:6690 length:483 start_codon:yes stop_codon:yes gene_type:complete